MKLKMIVAIVLAAAIAALGAGWKWHHGGGAKIAGWTWGDGAAMTEETY
jgi:hypothetical protein